ncbi:MAG: T9SS type A sorting domain-containing protein [bacterium]
MKIFSFIALFLSLLNITLAQTNISDIVNTYSKVVALSNDKTQVAVTDLNAFKTGDFVLIIQMKGILIDTSNSKKFGTVIDYRESGNYEFATIKEISNGMINFEDALCRDYDIQGIVQLIKVPVYDDAIVKGKLTAKIWDGILGGVLAIKVKNTLTLNSNIDVSGIGFMGGRLYNTSWECNQMDYYYPNQSWKGALKGEGAASIGTDKMAGRGALANGGGGGNCTNAGGAGGGNFGNGGHGGKQFLYACDSIDIGGLSGNRMLYSSKINKIFMGGGGGAGHQNDNAGTKGESGGGIIIIIAEKIEGNNFDILSNGLSAGSSQNDAAGGGGAGGTILFDINDFGNSQLNLSVTGGSGGNCNVGPYVHCYGTGGGGAGGCIWISQSNLPKNINILVDGGKNGIITNSNSPCYKSNYGAESGGSGAILYDLNLNFCCDESAFEFVNFKFTNNLILVKDTFHSDSTITLTASEYWKSGALWYSEKIPVKKGFVTEFSFKFSDGVNKYLPEDYPGADGICFVIQNYSQTAIGSPGGGLGYKSIPNSFVVEFDTYKNADDNSENFRDPSENHVGVFCNGINPNTTVHGSIANLATADSILPIIPDDRIFYSKIEYSPNKYFRVYLDSSKKFELAPVIELLNLDISNMLVLDSSEFAWVGFTSATGNSHEKHELLSWSICPKQTSTFLIGIDEQYYGNENSLKIYPNPANDVIKIEYYISLPSLVDIELHDLLGNKIISTKNYKTTGSFTEIFSTYNLSNGVYFIIVKINNSVMTDRVMIIDKNH